MTPRWATAGVLTAAVIAGCASSPHNPAAAQAGAAAQRILVLPLNVTLPLPAELEAGSDLVWHALSGYVEEHGKQVATVGLAESRKLWLEGIRQIEAGEREGPANYDSAARVLVTELRRQLEFDAVIIPSVFVQQARLSGRRARWDGITRRVQFDREVKRVGSVVTRSHMAGNTPGASLHVAILDADGNKLQESQAGLELLLWVTIAGPEGPPVHELEIAWELRPDLFESEADVREGIAMALDPFLPPIEGTP